MPRCGRAGNSLLPVERALVGHLALRRQRVGVHGEVCQRIQGRPLRLEANAPGCQRARAVLAVSCSSPSATIVAGVASRQTTSPASTMERRAFSSSIAPPPAATTARPARCEDRRPRAPETPPHPPRARSPESTARPPTIASVSIKGVPAEPLRQQPRNGRLAGAHEAGEGDVLGGSSVAPHLSVKSLEVPNVAPYKRTHAAFAAVAAIRASLTSLSADLEERSRSHRPAWLAAATDERKASVQCLRKLTYKRLLL